MNRYFSAVLLTLSFASVLPAADNPKDRWLGDIDRAIAAATKQDKPIFLVFR